MTTALAYEVFGDNGTLFIRNSQSLRSSDNLADLLEYLQFSGKRVIRVVFELDEFVAPLLRKLSPESLAELLETKNTNFGRFRLYYVPNIMFQVGTVGQKLGTRYYGIKNFLNIGGLLPTPPLEQVQETGQEILDAIDGIGLGGEHIRLTTPGAVFTGSAIGSEFMKDIPLGRHLPPAILQDTIALSALADDKY